ncbi:MAG: hypothetical protein ACOWWR_01005 [Eubacteriales bacterium]
MNNDKEEDNTDSEQITDYNTYFESVELQDLDNYSMERIQFDAHIIDIIDNENILCTKDNDLLEFNVKTQEKFVLVKDAWDPTLSEDKKLILYQNSEGVYIYNVKTKENSLLYKLNKEVLRNYILSDDNKHVFIQTLEGKEFINRLVTVGGKTNNVVLDENEDFIIIKLVHYSESKVFAIAETKEESAGGEEVNEKTDLVMVDFDRSSIRNITNVSSDNETRFLDNYKNNILIETMQQIIVDESIRTERIHYKVNTSNGIPYKVNLKDINTTMIKVLSTESEFIFLDDPEEIDTQYPDLKVVKLHDRSKDMEIAKIYIDVPYEIYHFNNKMFFTSNGDMYVITKKND